MSKNSILGIDIGTTNIALALLKQGKKQHIIDTALIPTPSGSIVNGEIKSIKLICSEIRNILSSKKMKPKKIAVNMNSSQIITREFNIGNVKGKEIKQAIEFELSQNFPNITQTHSISYKIYEKRKDNIKGIVAVCPNKLIDDFEQIGDNLGIPLKYLDVNSNSIAKAYKKFIWDNDNNSSVLIVDIGTYNSQVNIMVSDKLVVSRNVSTGGAAIDKLMSDVFNISLKEAESEKLRKFKEYLSDGHDIEKIIKQGYEGIQTEIGRTINLYNQKGFKEEIKNILLIGGGSRLYDIDKNFEEIFKIPVKVVKPTDNNTTYINNFSRLISAIGCSIRED